MLCGVVCCGVAGMCCSQRAVLWCCDVVGVGVLRIWHETYKHTRYKKTAGGALGHACPHVSVCGCVAAWLRGCVCVCRWRRGGVGGHVSNPISPPPPAFFPVTLVLIHVRRTPHAACQHGSMPARVCLQHAARVSLRSLSLWSSRPPSARSGTGYCHSLQDK